MQMKVHQLVNGSLFKNNTLVHSISYKRSIVVYVLGQFSLIFLATVLF